MTDRAKLIEDWTIARRMRSLGRMTAAGDALSAALSADEGWREISEHDGLDRALVLLWVPSLQPRTIQAQWDDDMQHWIDVWDGDPIGTSEGPIRPTHWRPLPQPPEPEA